MNLADSVKKVLRTRSHHIFKDFWRDDLKNIISDIASDVARFGRTGAGAFRSIKKTGLKVSLNETIESGADVLLIFKVLPLRVRDGFANFKEEFIGELDKLPDQKQKTIFCLKVLGALTSFGLNGFYSIKKGRTEFSLSGLRRRNAFTRFIVAELIFKISQVFIYRFLNELEGELTLTEDLRKVRYFKKLISVRPPIDSLNARSDYQEDEGDPSFVLIENLKRFIMTGK